MGLFDKVKSMANAVTGGAARVTLNAAPLKIGEPCELTVQAVAKDNDVEYNRVYVLVRGREKVELLDRDPDRTERIRRHETTFDSEIVVEGSGKLEANEEKTWTCELVLPASALPVYRGRHAEHYYEVQAGLDCAGNDPDSGWIRLQVS